MQLINAGYYQYQNYNLLIGNMACEPPCALGFSQPLVLEAIYQGIICLSRS